MTDARKEYDTGAVRSGDCEETRYDLITPIGLRALAQTYAEGMRKFGYCNWENGMPVTDLLNHAIAHIYKFLGGDRDEDHLAHAAWNLLGAIHSMEMWPQLNEQFLRGPNCDAPPIAKQLHCVAQTCSLATDINRVVDSIAVQVHNTAPQNKPGGSEPKIERSAFEDLRKSVIQRNP